MRSFRRLEQKAEWPPWLHPRDARAVLVDIDVRPETAEGRIVGEAGARLRIAVPASHWGGEANRALVRFLSRALRIAAAQIAVVGGHTGRKKTVCLLGVPPQRVLLRLAPRPL